MSKLTRIRSQADLRAKRLTDAELAAEVWCAREDLTGCLANLQGWDIGTEDRNRARRAVHRARNFEAVMNRFATHPHYDEDAA